MKHGDVFVSVSRLIMEIGSEMKHMTNGKCLWEQSQLDGGATGGQTVLEEINCCEYKLLTSNSSGCFWIEG